VRKLRFLTSGMSLLDKQRYYRTGSFGMASGYSRGRIISLADKDVYGVKHNRAKRQTTVFRGFEGQAWKATSPLVIKDFLVTADKAVLGGYLPSKDKPAGKIAFFSTKDGTLLNTLDIGAPPVFQGMSVARGHLYISTEKGTVICLQSQ